MIVEVGIKLNKDLKYYDNMLKQYGFKNDFTVISGPIPAGSPIGTAIIAFDI